VLTRVPTVEKELDLSLGPVSRASLRESLSIQRRNPSSKIVQIQRGVKKNYKHSVPIRKKFKRVNLHRYDKEGLSKIGTLGKLPVLLYGSHQASNSCGH
jgi:hypothetical protein